MYRPFFGLPIGTAAGLAEDASRSMISGQMMMKIALADIALSAATAPRHHMVARGAGAAAGVLGGYAGYSAGAALGAAVGSVIAPGIGTAVGGFLGGIAGGAVGDLAVRDPVEHGVQTFANFAGRMARLEMGGNYLDTQAALTMRQVAVREMSGSLLNARQWLGKESLLMHQ
jgi:hypothetical protein